MPTALSEPWLSPRCPTGPAEEANSPGPGGRLEQQLSRVRGLRQRTRCDLARLAVQGGVPGQCGSAGT